MGWLLLGSIPGVLITSRMTIHFPERTLRIALATTLAVSGVKLTDIPNTNAFMIVALVIGLVLLGIVEMQRRNGPVPLPARR
jgi:hypothetical protein